MYTCTHIYVYTHVYGYTYYILTFTHIQLYTNMSHVYMRRERARTN